jgi:putative ABC transport system permease protein
VTRRTAALVALGVVIGLFAGVQGARLSERLLYGVVPADPVSILGAVAVIAIVAIVAAAAPANRARRVSPVRALRMDG